MRSMLLLWCLGGSAAIALLVVLGLSPAQQQSAQTKAAESPSATGNEPRQTKSVPVPVQAELRWAQASKSEFKNPPESASKDFHQLRLTTGTFLSPHANEVQAPDKFELLCYNGQPVGPTIRVRRGTTFHIRVKNDLKSNDPNPPIVPDPVPPNGQAQQPHDLCTTNLHTHGLHVSPASNADNVFRSIEPGGEFTFEYTITADHHSGTFWYHPHHHGSVAYQVSNGLAGALIVEGSPNDGVPDLEKIPEIAAAKEQILVFQLYNFRTGDDKVGRIDANKIYNVTPQFFTCPAIALSGKDPGDTPQATAINGVINPIIRIRPGEVQRWRLIHAAWDLDRQFTLVDGAGAAAKDLMFQEIALDGLATGAMVQKSNVESDDGSNVDIAPGQRSDVLIKVPLLKQGESERTYFLKQSAVSTALAPHNRAQNPLYLAKIIVAAATTAAPCTACS
jgi:FtsP/CotA-like multicopper oxidase with cupredoxin domain